MLELTDREYDVMDVLWRRGSGTVAEVRSDLTDELAYTTVLWVLQTLESKGHVNHQKEGRAYRYRPLVQRDVARGTALNSILHRLFNGSASLLLASLVAERELPEEEVEQMIEVLTKETPDRRSEK